MYYLRPQDMRPVVGTQSTPSTKQLPRRADVKSVCLLSNRLLQMSQSNNISAPGSAELKQTIHGSSTRKDYGDS